MADLTRRSLVKWGAGGAALQAASCLISRPARAATRLRVLTYFFAEPSQGGLFQAAATGLYEKAGLDVEVKQGGPQINGLQLLAGGDADVVMTSGIAVLNSRDRNVPLVAIAAPLQFDLQCLVTRRDIPSIAALKGHKILVTAGGQGGYWLWLKQRFGFTDDQLGPYTGNLQPFVQDPTMALGGIVTSEPYRIQQAGIEPKTFLLANDGYPPYGGPLVAMESTVASRRDEMARFVRATMMGWRDFMLHPEPGLRMIQEMNPQADDGWMAYSVAKQRELRVVTGGDAETMGIGTMTEARWGQLATFMTDVKLIKPTTDWRAAFTTEFVRDLKI